jgi:hypothetical protein
MTIKRLLTAIYTSAYFIGAATAEQVTPSVDALTDGIRTFICDFEDSGSTSIILVENEDRWRIVGDEFIDDVAEISSGFRFRTSKSESFLGILKEVNDQWIFNYLSEHWSFSGECQIMDEFSEKLVLAIAPKIFENADSLEAELRKIKEELRVSKDVSTSLNRRLIDLERENKIIEKNNKLLKDEIISIQKREKETIERNEKLLKDEILAIRIRHANLLESVTNGHAVKAYEFISEALSVKEVTKRIAFVLGGGLGDATGRDKFCVDLLMNQPTKFGDTCRRRLIMYMIEDAERKRDLSARMSSDHLREPLTAEKTNHIFRVDGTAADRQRAGCPALGCVELLERGKSALGCSYDHCRRWGVFAGNRRAGLRFHPFSIVLGRFGIGRAPGLRGRPPGDNPLWCSGLPASSGKI